MSWREVMQAGAMGVVDSGIELMGQGRDEYDSAQEVFDRAPVVTPSAMRYLAIRGLADVLREVRDEAQTFDQN
jgi:hypothetical protein